MEPLISVIIPVYNGEKYITEAINSVLRQNYENIEILVINDGSTDNTLEVLKTFGNKIKIFSKENKGPSAARNVGLKNARGSIIGLLDADDVWTDNHIAVCLPDLINDSGYDFVHGLTRYVTNLGTPQETILKELYTEASGAASLYKKSLFEKIGFFDEEMPEGEDLDIAIRITEAGGREKRVPETTLLYRRHENNMTNDPAVIARGQMNAFRKKLARAKQNK
jgi:glycosyltransferase involved in cell wall biosynthesis